MESFPHRKKTTWFCLWGGNYLWTTLAAFLSDLLAGFIAAFPRHGCSLEDLEGTPLNVVWVSSSELCPWCWERGGEPQAGFLLLSSLPSVALPASVLYFLVRVHFSLSALFNPSVTTPFAFTFDFSWLTLTVLALIVFPAFGGCEDRVQTEQINKWIPQAVNGNQYNLTHNWQNH